jgi:hypothetical protein
VPKKNKVCDHGLIVPFKISIQHFGPSTPTLYVTYLQSRLMPKEGPQSFNTASHSDRRSLCWEVGVEKVSEGFIGHIIAQQRVVEKEASRDAC